MSSMLEGTLSKWTNVMKGWQYRWFVLEDNAGLLSYYTSKEKMMKGVRRGCVRLKGAILGIDDQDVNTFTITVDHKTFHFQASDFDEREKWVRRLEDTIFKHTNRGRHYLDIRRPYSVPASYSDRNNFFLDFDKKVSEADAYLQLMIDQTAVIENQIQNLTEEEKVSGNKIYENAKTMLESIKYSIVLLQIAKNTAHPINIALKNQITDPVGSDMKLDISPEHAPQDALRHHSINSNSSSMIIMVPETSYSSSEGEDDFYDANDDVVSNSQRNTPICNVNTSLSLHDHQDVGKAPYVDDMCDNDDEFDALYDDDENTLMMQNHGSVVTHLLSQVKIGMDLTKVVLPTFILERRSLLEMYADYFAHPDLFLRIGDFKDPKDRIVQVVRWYLSAYHAGRKSSVAKKPYNPILGEVFQCHWDVDEVDHGEMKTVDDGPLPWCRQNQLTFIAEQVSHHPPISAFYAEHYEKQISFSAYVWTKSKFLGLSIGVHNIGQGIITLCDLNEEYVVTFPNGYGRSILTVPWIELGGTVTISCAKTGYHAEIDFQTKPFYGGKRNRISAEIYCPLEKKSFMTIAGEWSGLMEAKSNDVYKGKSEVFVDVNRMPIYKKRVRPVSKQDALESRKVWSDVTAALKLNDIGRATNAKSIVEQKQRDEAKQRKDDCCKWESKLFIPVGDGWMFSNQLMHRLKREESNASKSSSA